ncbi:MAG: restriction endonuclease subunit S [Bacteroidaceae bacterium]|nr:restriction endonuclease subunit S [Bacteroidaceae bacterium]
MKENWTYKKLGEIANVSAGQSAPQGDKNYCLDGTPFIKAGNLENLINGKNENEVQKVSDEVALSHRLKKYKKGSVLFAKSGMSCMKGWVYTLKNDCYVVSHLAIVTPKSINSSFLNYYFKVNKPNKLVKDSAYPSISLKDIENFQVPIPPMEEQERIVAELDLLQSVIDKKKAQLDEYDKLAQSIFYEMFGDPIDNPKKWEVKKLGEIVSFKNGINYHPKDGGFLIKCIGVGDFQNRNELRYFHEIKNFTIEEVVDESYYLEDGDILIVRSNGSKELVGRNMIVYPQEQKVTYSGFCIRCRLITLSVLPIILHCILSDRNTMIVLRQEGRGCNISNINQKILSSLPIIMPPTDLQKQFAEKIEAIEHQKELVKQSLSEVKTLFDSRMDYYFN